MPERRLEDLAANRRTLPTTLDEFWQLARAAQSAAVHLTDKKLQAVQTMDLLHLQRTLIQYRWFTAYYPGDMSLLILKLPPSKLRSLIGELLAEELGDGNPARAHLALYDNFLLSLGVLPPALEESANPSNIALLDSIRLRLMTGDFAHAIGLKGMGGECLCQVYLESLHHYLIRNPIIQAMQSKLDMTFWDIHAGEEDQAHAARAREGIELLVGPDHIRSLSLGYMEAERMWQVFWDNAYGVNWQVDRVGFGRRMSEYPLLPNPSDGMHYEPNR